MSYGILIKKHHIRKIFGIIRYFEGVINQWWLIDHYPNSWISEFVANYVHHMLFLILEQFWIEFRKTKTKVIPGTNHRKDLHYHQPMKTSKLLKSAGKHEDQIAIVRLIGGEDGASILNHCNQRAKLSKTKAIPDYFRHPTEIYQMSKVMGLLFFFTSLHPLIDLRSLHYFSNQSDAKLEIVVIWSVTLVFTQFRQFPRFYLVHCGFHLSWCNEFKKSIASILMLMQVMSSEFSSGIWLSRPWKRYLE